MVSRQLSEKKQRTCQCQYNLPRCVSEESMGLAPFWEAGTLETGGAQRSSIRYSAEFRGSKQLTGIGNVHHRFGMDSVLVLDPSSLSCRLKVVKTYSVGGKEGSGPDPEVTA